MKNKLLLLLSLFYSLVGLSQADDVLATVEWAAPMPKTIVRIIHSDSANFYYAGKVSSGFLSSDEIFGKMRVEDMEKEIEITKEIKKFKNDNPEILGYKVKGDELHGFYMHYDPKTDLKSILVRKIIDEDRKSGDYKIIGSIESSRSFKTTLSYEWSENDSILMLVGSPEKDSKSDNEAVEFKVLDYNYDLMYECRIELDFEDRFFEIVSYRITNSGHIMILGYKVPNKKKGEKWERKESNETYFLYVYDVDKDELIEYDLGLKDKFITNIDIKTDFEENKSVIYGIYSNYTFFGMAGSFYLSINQLNYEVMQEKFNPFDKEFMKLMSNRKSQKKKLEEGKLDEIVIKDVVLRNIIRKEDGGHLVVFENYNFWISTSTMTTNSQGAILTNRTETYNYMYNEIFVQNYSSDGDVIWTAYIPKYQYTKDDGGIYSGYMLMVDENRLHFVYNDHKKNEKLWGTEKSQRVNNKFKNANLVMVTLTEDGDLSYNVLMPTRIEKFMIMPRFSKMLGKNSNQGIIMAGKDRVTKLGKGSRRFGKLEIILD